MTKLFVGGGFISFSTNSIEKVREFYVDVLGMDVVFEDKDKIALRMGNVFLRFEKGESIGKGARIKILLRDKESLEKIYERAKEFVSSVKRNSSGDLESFEIIDFEGRVVEVGYGGDIANTFMLGDTLLLTRRSIRYFEDRDVPEDVLWKIFEICRFSPTSKNSQSYYFVVIRRRDILDYLANLRGGASAPIGRAPMAVAICSDPKKSKRYIQDACIAAYHFILTAWFFGLGTCWIAAMDRDDVKDLLGIPRDHYIATITPLGYPKFVPKPPPRRKAREMVKFLD